VKPSGVVSLLTDFGLADPYVGVMKAAVLREFAAARLVDLCHEISPHDIVSAAFWLGQSYRYFPPGSVHVAVVDPGVGSERAALLVVAQGHCFLGPDNGLLAGLAQSSDALVFRLDPVALGLAPLSRTFHGRDLFAPVAGRLAAGGLQPSEVGPSASVQVPDPLAKPLAAEGELRGQVVLIDRFGNALTNIEAGQVSKQSALSVLGRPLPIVEAYAEAEAGACVGLIGSFGVLEIAARNDSAARMLGLTRGAEVILRP
jgi:S-adenosylmethionine hydrolase